MSASRTSGAEMSASRTSSSSPSYHTVDESPLSKLCDCGLNPKLATSFTVKNPYRRFLRCPKFQRGERRVRAGEEEGKKKRRFSGTEMSASRTSGAEMSASRTSSSSPSYHTVDESPLSKFCDCGLNPKLATSFTVKNPYRRFLRCPKFQPHQCGFFRWVDAWRPPQVEDVSTLNGEAERAKVNMWIQMYSYVLKDLDNRWEVMKQLGVQIVALQKENKKLKKELFMVRVIIASIVLLVVAIILA